MAAPDLALQGAIVAALKAAGGVSAIVGANVLDRVPQSPAYPMVTVGASTLVLERADLYEGQNVTFAVHAWSREPGFVQVRNLGWEIKKALDRVDLTVAGCRLLDLVLVDETTFRDPDGQTSHAALNFRAELEAS